MAATLSVPDATGGSTFVSADPGGGDPEEVNVDDSVPGSARFGLFRGTRGRALRAIPERYVFERFGKPTATVETEASVPVGERTVVIEAATSGRAKNIREQLVAALGRQSDMRVVS